jgi:hypothetical protein
MGEMGGTTTPTRRSAGNDVIDRMMRVIGRPHRERAGLGYFLAQMGVLAAVCFGAWWTVQAVAEGRPAMVVLRFTLSAALGLYYLVLARIVRAPGRQR